MSYQKRLPVPLSADELDLIIDCVTARRSQLFSRQRLADQLLPRLEGVSGELARQPNPMEGHRYDLDTDRCLCGGGVVHFSDGDADGDVGEGCEVAGRVWSGRGG
jgi:hypothetical protein